MILERVALTGLLLAHTLAGRSFFAFHLRRLEHRFERAGLHSYRASLPNGDVRYWAGGNPNGRPLLLVHGFGGDATWCWVDQLALAKDHFLIVPDLLWFGGSAAKGDDFSTTWQAGALVQLMDHLAVREADVVGISYGGFVTLELAHGWPERAGRIVLVDSPGHTYTLDDYHAMLERLGLESVAELVVPAEASGVRRLVQLAYHRPPPVPMFVARDVFAHMYQQWTDQKVRLLDHLLARAARVAPDEYRIHQPTLILWGDKDPLFPPDLGHRLAGQLGGDTRVALIPDASHAPNVERPGVFNARVLDFLRSNIPAIA